ncbi:MAG: hypothetical protein M3P46_03300 [Actinomycetota bacterium]|nr:hypothetical protein [Actinomycetota bacterium]
MSVEVLTRDELVRVAGGEASARRMLRDGDWVRVLRDAYVPRGIPDDVRTRAAALRRVLPPDVAVAGRAALWLAGVPLLDGSDIDVVVPRGRHLVPRPGVRPRAALVPDEELCAVDGLLVVAAARVVVDLARREPLVEAAVCGDAALRSGVTDLALVRASLDGPAVCGASRRRACVQHLEPRSESPMETRLRLKFALAGRRELEVQRDLYDEHGHVGRAELYVDGVVLEFDGRAARLDPGVFVAERRRQVRIAELGLELRRYTAPDVYRRSGAHLVAELERAQRLARGRWEGLLIGPDTLRPPRLRPLPLLADVRRAA